MSAADAVVIGAGWAGLSAALGLAEHGLAVTVLDAAPQAGGRARSQRLTWSHPVHGPVPVELDNGQHLLIGAYVETLGLLGRLGAIDATTVERRPLRIIDSGGLTIARRRFARDGPGEAGTTLGGALLEPLTPLLALLTARGLAAASRWALVRTLAGGRLAGWRPAAGVRTVTDWIGATGQPAELVRLLWQPLVVSTMNTPLDQACAATFLRVLKDSLGGPPTATDYLLPRRPLGDFFVAPVLGALAARGARVLLRHDVRRIDRGERRRYRVATALRPGVAAPLLETDRIVVATPPVIAAKLLGPVADADLLAALAGFRYRPITTAYAGWPADRLPEAGSLAPVLGLRADPGRGRHAHWLFDRGRHGPWRIGALVISDSGAARTAGDPTAAGDDALTNALIRQLGAETGLPPPDHLTLIHEKRATIACTPERPRLEAGSALARLPGLALAGDYAWPDYPATLEAAVRSGLAAAAVLRR